MTIMYNTIIMKIIRIYKNVLVILFLVLLVSLSEAFGQKENIIIDIDFPGGNIIVEDDDNVSTLYYDITGDTILIRPDLRDTEGNWFYWYFRVTGAASRTLYFQFPRGSFISAFGPAIISDNNQSWKWLYDDVQDNFNSFSYTFGPDENQVRFSSTIPYLQADFDNYISLYKHNPYLSTGLLNTSEKGRSIEKVYIQHPESNPKFKVLITARHHAGESIASYVLEGFLSSILDQDNSPLSPNRPNSPGSSLSWLQENVEFLIIPFMDKDGVEDGDQGKNRRPHDHNRDYSGESIYNSVASLRDKVAAWGEGKLKVALDLHCPWIRGEWNEHIYFVGSGKEEIAREQKKYVDILLSRHSGELTIKPDKSILEYGKAWNVGIPPGQGLSFSRWASEIEGISFSSTVEVPFSINNGQKITPQNARLFGRDLADALSVYLQGF